MRQLGLMIYAKLNVSVYLVTNENSFVLNIVGNTIK